MPPLISTTYHPALTGLIQDLVADDLLTAIEIVPDRYLEESPESRGLLDSLAGVIEAVGLPYSFHLVENSLLSADHPPVNRGPAFFQRLKRFSPILFSEHLTCSSSGELALAGNLATLYTEDALAVACANVRAFAADAWPEIPFLLEHIPTYFTLRASTMPWERFYLELIERTGANILLDMNNLYCEEVNRGFDAAAFMRSLPRDRVLEIHVAGGTFHDDAGGKQVYYDGHNADVPERVFELLELALARFAPRLVNLEREGNFRDFDRIFRDVERMSSLCRRTRAKK